MAGQGQHNKRYYTFDRFLKERIGVKVRKVSVNAGFTCPNRDGKVGYGGCVFCHNPGFTPSRDHSGSSIRTQIEEETSRLRNRGFTGKFLVYFQPYSNTYASVHTLKRLCDEALEAEDVVGLSIGTRPDCVPDDVLLLLEKYARKRLLWIEYGLQSANDKTLEHINRGHNYAQFEDAVKRTRNRGIYICAHIILGLPGEDQKDMFRTVEKLSDVGVDGVKIHHLQVVKGTVLEERYCRGEAAVFSARAYVPLVCDIVERLSPKVVIHRLMGDTQDQLLVAPRWDWSKTEVLSRIDKELERRGSYQGRCYGKS